MGSQIPRLLPSPLYQPDQCLPPSLSPLPRWQKGPWSWGWSGVFPHLSVTALSGPPHFFSSSFLFYGGLRRVESFHGGWFTCPQGLRRDWFRWGLRQMVDKACLWVLGRNVNLTGNALLRLEAEWGASLLEERGEVRTREQTTFSSTSSWLLRLLPWYLWRQRPLCWASDSAHALQRTTSLAYYIIPPFLTWF